MAKKSKKIDSLMMAIPESGPSVEVNIYNDGDKREGKAEGGLPLGFGDPVDMSKNEKEARRFIEQEIDGAIIRSTNRDNAISQHAIDYLNLVRKGELGSHAESYIRALDAEAERSDKFLGGLADMPENIGTQGANPRKPNLLEAPLSVENIKTMDYVTTTQGQQEMEQAQLGMNEGGDVDVSQFYLAPPKSAKTAKPDKPAKTAKPARPLRETPQELGIAQPPFYTSQRQKDGQYKMDEAIRMEQFSNWRDLRRQGFDLQEKDGQWLAKRISRDSAEIYPVDENTWTLKKREPQYREDGRPVGSAPIIERDGGYIKKQEGGMAMPPELMAEEEVPVDTYPNIPPEEMAEAEASQLPDDEMEDNYLDHILSQALSEEEQQYLMESLEADPRLSSIIDKLVVTASEFTGEGEVDGPGTGVSDSIPARLSDGEFVITEKATSQIGADNLQTMMDDAERAYDGGLQKYVLGGAVDDKVLGGAVEELASLQDEKPMYGTQRQQSEMKKQMMYANRMPSIIGER